MVLGKKIFAQFGDGLAAIINSKSCSSLNIFKDSTIKINFPIFQKPIRYPIFFIGKDKEIHGKINSVNHYRIFLAFNIDEDEGINTVNLKKILQEFIKRNNLNNNVEEWVENHAKIIKFTKEINGYLLSRISLAT